MKNALMKFAGFFVEKVPIEEQVAPPGATPTGEAGSAAGPATAHPGSSPADLMQGHFPSPSGRVAMPPSPGQPRPEQQRPVAVALRAWIPQEYAAYLTPFGLHVIAAGGELTVEQARAYGAQVLVVSAECLGSHTHLLVHPQLPTVFVTPQPTMIPPNAGVVQVQEPLRASEVAQAAREALAAWQ